MLVFKRQSERTAQFCGQWIIGRDVAETQDDVAKR